MIMKWNKKIILIVIAALILVGAGTWYYFYTEGQKYYSTDNAKVMAELKTVTATTGGELVKWDAAPNLLVTENQVIGRTSTGADIKSPITGIVVKSNVVLNQSIAPSAPLAVIADVSDVYVQVNIEETAISKLALGQSVQIKLDAFPGKQFKGHVREIDPVTVAALSGNATSFSTSGTYTKVTQLIPVKVAIDDSLALDKLIGTNAFVNIRLEKVDASVLQAQSNKNTHSTAFEVSGKIKAKKTKDIALDFSATVTDVFATEGQRLKSGDSIVQIDLKDLQKMISDQEKNLKIESLQLQKLQNSANNSSLTENNSLKTAEDNLLKAQDDLAKQEQLLNAGASTTEALNEAKRKLTAAERTLADVKLSKKADFDLSLQMQREKIALMTDQLKLLKNKLKPSYIKGNQIVCEFENAMVQDIRLVSGNLLSPGMKLFSLVDLSSLIVEADIPENKIKLAQVGSPVTIIPVSDESRSYKGVITALSASATLKNGETIITAEIAITAPDDSLKPNFNVSVNIGQ